MSNAQILNKEEVTKGRRLSGLTDLTKDLAGEKFLAHKFPGMVIVYEIIKATPRTVTLRETKRGERSWVSPHNPNDVYEEAIPNDREGARTKTHRISAHNGVIKVGNYANAGTYFIPDSIDGMPLSMTNLVEY